MFAPARLKTESLLFVVLMSSKCSYLKQHTHAHKTREIKKQMRRTSIAPALRLNAFNANDDDEEEDIATLSSSALRRRGTTTTTNGKKFTRRNKTNRIHFDDESMEMEMKEKLEKQRKYREELEMQLRSERKRREEEGEGITARDGRRMPLVVENSKICDTHARKSHAAQVLEAERAEYENSPRLCARTVATTMNEKEREEEKMDKSKRYQRDLLLQIEQNRERKREEKEEERRMERMMSSTSAASSTSGGGGGYNTLLKHREMDRNGDKVDPTAAYGRRESFAREQANAEYERALKRQIEEKKRRKEEEKRKMREMEIEEERKILRDLERMNAKNNASGSVYDAGVRGKSKTEERVVVEEERAENVANIVVEEEEVGELLSFSEFVFPTTDEELDVV